MSDRFYKDIEVPSLPNSANLPAPDDGFISIYGKNGKLATKNASNVEVIYDLSTGGGASYVPTLVEESFLVPTNKQILFTKKITLAENQRIILEGILVEVN